MTGPFGRAADRAAEDGVVILCWRPEHLPGGRVDPGVRGSTLIDCSNCQRPVWIAPSGREVLELATVEGRHSGVECCCCAGFHTEQELFRLAARYGAGEFHWHHWEGPGRCVCGMDRDTWVEELQRAREDRGL
jgi:hypothetical protein